MPSTFFNQLKMMLRPSTANRESALANNYTYINEDKISRSLLCPICLDPLLDPLTHVPCDNSFCNLCIRKLRQCPCCRASMTHPHDLKTTSHVLRNILDELEVQCNICRQTLARGHFSMHIRNNCLTQSPASSAEEHNLLNLSTLPTASTPVACPTQLDEQQIEKHLSNLYRRIHALESELFELKKAIYVCLFVLAAIGALIFLGSIFSYVVLSFLSVVFTEWLPSILQASSKFLFDFSPSMTLLRIVFTGLYFFLFCYKRQPSDISLVTIIVCSLIVIFNVLILVIYLIVNHFNILFLLYGILMTARYYRVQPPNNEQLRNFFTNLRRLAQPQH